MNELLIGFLAFLASFLGCFQMINVTSNRRLMTAVTSCLIGVSQLNVYRLAPQVDGTIGVISYVIGGILGSQLAMLANKKPNEDE